MTKLESKIILARTALQDKIIEKYGLTLVQYSREQICPRCPYYIEIRCLHHLIALELDGHLCSYRNDIIKKI